MPVNPVSPATAFRGQRHIAALTSTQIEPDVLPRICKWEPSTAAFLTTLRMLRKTRTVVNPKYDLWEQKPIARKVAISGTVTAGNTTVTLKSGDAKNIYDYQLLRNMRTGEIFRADAGTTNINTSTDTLSVCTRGVGGTASPAMADGDEVMLLSPAYAEGTEDGTAMGWLQDTSYNYTQTTKTPIEASRRAQKIKLYGGYDWNEERVIAGLEHKRQMNRNLLFGRRSTGTDSNGKQITTTGGLLSYISTNWSTLAIRPTWRGFCDLIEPYFRYGEGMVGENGMGEKHMIASPRWMTFFSEFCEKYLSAEMFNVSEPERKNITFGWRVTKLLTPHGILYLHREQEWTHFTDLAGLSIIFDPNHLRLVYFDGGQTKLLKDRGATSLDGNKETYLSDYGLDVEVEGAHGVIDGLPE